LSVALLGSDCQSETIDYTDEGFICQAAESRVEMLNLEKGFSSAYSYQVVDVLAVKWSVERARNFTGVKK
jgi:hypothetical protein